jgi:large subunit ribosomal protein L21
MIAVVKTGGKQYRVTENDVIRVAKLGVEAGEKVTFDDILYVDNGSEKSIGTPMVKGASVTGTVLRNARDRKVIVYKMKPKKNYRVKTGHRQDFTAVKIDTITAG